MTIVRAVLRPYAAVWNVIKEMPRAMNDIVRLRPLRHGWRHDRSRTIRIGLWTAFWYGYFWAAVWWVSR